MISFGTGKFPCIFLHSLCKFFHHFFIKFRCCQSYNSRHFIILFELHFDADLITFLHVSKINNL